MSDDNQTFTQHEQASVDMFRHMLEKNQQVRDEFERWGLSIEEHGKFIAELIMGKPDQNSPQVSNSAYIPVCYVYCIFIPSLILSIIHA